jgi:serine/threonine protein kinase
MMYCFISHFAKRKPSNTMAAYIILLCQGTLTAPVHSPFLFGCDHSLSSLSFHTQCSPILQYLAPELLAGRLTRAADVWAFGLIALELWDGEGAYANLSSGHIMLLLSGGGNPPPAPENCPYKNVIEACLRWNPSERCTFTTIVEALQRIEA